MRVSVVMPVLNGEEYIAEAIDSVIAQTLAPAELLVVDNGSTDRTVAIASDYGDPVRVLSESIPSASAARLTGVAAASGDALMFMDADDLLGSTALEEMAAVLRDHPGTVACCPWRRYERIDGEWQVRPPSCTPRKAGQHPLAAWLSGWYHPPCSVLWSMEAYQRSGGWNPDCKLNQDGDLMMRALASGVPLIRTTGGVAYYRRLPEGNVSLSGQRFTAAGLAAKLDVIEGIEKKLEENRMVEQFRVALQTAFKLIAQDAAGQPELLARAEAGAARNTPSLMQAGRDIMMRARNKLGLAKDVPEFSGSA